MKERLAGEPDPAWSAIAGDPARAFSAQDVLRGAREGSRMAAEVVRTAVDYLARGISIINYIVNPERYILGGGIMQAERAGELIVVPVIARLREICRYKPFRSSVVRTELGSDSVIRGCVVLAQGGA
jgi:glucokinase